jgi:hypothetical protein
MRPTRIGGGGSEAWMMIVPIAVGAFLVTVVLGGPRDTLYIMERLAYEALDLVQLSFRR